MKFSVSVELGFRLVVMARRWRSDVPLRISDIAGQHTVSICLCLCLCLCRVSVPVV